MTEISNDSCRFCLKKCTQFDIDYDFVHVDLYLISTGYKIAEESYLKKICEPCNKFLTDFQLFRERAREVEEQLSLAVQFDRELNPLRLAEFKLKEDSNFDYEDTQLPESPEPDIETCSKVRPAKKSKVRVRPGVKKKKFLCEICKERSFTLEVYLRKHKLQVHRVKEVVQEPPTTCTACDRTFTNNLRLKEHIQRMHGEKDQICHLCGKAYSTERALQIHFHITHPVELDFASYICDFCNKQYTGRHNILHHFKNWHKLRECKPCNKKYYSYHSWLLHRQALHEPLKQFSCDSCSKTFSTKKYLQQHKKVHSQTGYICPVCPDQKFSFSTTLRSHISSKHQEINLPPSGTTLRNYKWNLD